MPFLFKVFQMTSLHTAVEKENIEIVRLLLSNEKINVNLQNIFESIFLFIKFQKNYFSNSILL
mgnify:CR=1 FL=1